MPTLGFLKKKRTREDKTDPSSSQPTSPVTPVTPTRGFESFNTIPSKTTSNTSAPTQPQPTSQNNEVPVSAGGGSQMNPPAVHHQPIPYGIQQSPSPGHMVTPHNLPSINNLINLPQIDGMHSTLKLRGKFSSNLYGRPSWHAPTTTPRTGPGTNTSPSIPIRTSSNKR
jgi:protein kinase A